MKSSDLIQLERAFRKRTGGQGDHVKSINPGRPGHVVVAHLREDIAPATLGNAYRQADWDGG